MVRVHNSSLLLLVYQEVEAEVIEFPSGPFGVVSAVEFIGIVLFIVYVVYSMTYYALESVSLVSKFDIPSKTDRYVQ